MIVGMGGWVAAISASPRRQTAEKRSREVRASNSKSRCQEELCVARIFASGIERGVGFQFGPKFPRPLILESRIPQQLPA